MQVAKNNPPPEPQAQSEDTERTPISVIFYNEIFNTDGSTPGAMTAQVQAHLCSGAENLEVDQIGNASTLTIGNREGLKEAAEATSDLERCKTERASLADRVSNLELTVKHQDERIRNLEAESAARSQARMRFLSTFKRDYLPDKFDVTFEDSKTIRAGNREAHDPDPLADCELYMQFRRHDAEAFSALYGLPPLRVYSLRSRCYLIPPHDLNMG